MFVISKLVGFFLQPLAWVGLLLVLALLMGRWRGPAAGRRWTMAALTLLVFLGSEVPPTLLLRPLEDRYPVRRSVPDGIAGAVILGGIMGPGSIAQLRGQVPLKESAERITQAVVLARQHPAWTMVFAGGDGRILSPGQWPEADLAARFWQEQGLPAAQLRLEDQSRNTVENARFAARLPGIDPQAGWLLITSAWHMPRAMAAFERAGWRVTPWPVDYMADPQVRWTDYSLVRGPRLWEIVLKEYVGILALRLQ